MYQRKRRFTKMYDDYANDIFKFVYVHVQDRALAEDLTADTFHKAWQKIDTFDFKQPRPWLYTIARNNITDHWRSKRSLPLDEGMDVIDHHDSTEMLMDKAFAKADLMDAIAKLPLTMQSVVTLRFIHGYSARKTGQALQMTEVNVRVLQHRALKKLRGLLQ